MSSMDPWAATFPLQILGFDVDPLNAVQFSNHTGYPKFTGERLEGPQIVKLLEGLQANGFMEEYSHLLSGYLGRPSSLHAVADFIRDVKAINPSITFFLDPVMGDDHKLYVPKELIPIYRDVLCPLADVITPNSFEAELLTDIPVTTTALAIQAFDKLHSLGVPTVIITSAELTDRKHQTPHLHLLASQIQPSSSSSNTNTNSSHASRLLISFPRLAASFTGTGDLLASLLLAHMHDAKAELINSNSTTTTNSTTSQSPSNLNFLALKLACERAVASMQGVLLETMKSYQVSHSEIENDAAARGGAIAMEMRCRELKLIQSKKIIENPVITFRAIDI
ncbi:hypothetical protein HDU76_010564 [Blyttiomyces sp. JEL0837]|nr:hypothetical protein HDU76_010564 [Blyttiomyces sp. JEL0837]